MSASKLAKYDRLYEQIRQYVQTTDDIWARLATMEAVLHHKMQSFFWTGVYALIDDELIVRSYQGPVACQKLKHHTGVCWAAVNSGETVNFRDTSPVTPCRRVRSSFRSVTGKGGYLPAWMWIATD